MAEAEIKSDFELRKNTKPMGCYYDDFEDNWLHYNGITLYTVPIFFTFLIQLHFVLIEWSRNDHAHRPVLYICDLGPGLLRNIHAKIYFSSTAASQSDTKLENPY